MVTTATESQMEKQMDNDMETGIDHLDIPGLRLCDPGLTNLRCMV